MFSIDTALIADMNRGIEDGLVLNYRGTPTKGVITSPDGPLMKIAGANRKIFEIVAQHPHGVPFTEITKQFEGTKVDVDDRLLQLSIGLRRYFPEGDPFTRYRQQTNGGVGELYIRFNARVPSLAPPVETFDAPPTPEPPVPQPNGSHAKGPVPEPHASNGTHANDPTPEHHSANGVHTNGKDPEPSPITIVNGRVTPEMSSSNGVSHHDEQPVANGHESHTPSPTLPANGRLTAEHELYRKPVNPAAAQPQGNIGMETKNMKAPELDNVGEAVLLQMLSLAQHGQNINTVSYQDFSADVEDATNKRLHKSEIKKVQKRILDLLDHPDQIPDNMRQTLDQVKKIVPLLGSHSTQELASFLRGEVTWQQFAKTKANV